jgi:hypothetical protein
VTAQTLPRQRTQLAFCPYCDQLVPGLESWCNKPACITAEIAESVALDRQCEARDE